MRGRTAIAPIEILLVEDNLPDIRLTIEAFKDAKVRNTLHVAHDGEQAMAFLAREGPYKAVPRPDLILLDLNLPRKDGREVLDEIKRDERFEHIPVIILTTSQAEQDILRSYQLRANAFITKPVDLDEFFRVIKTIEQFWLEIVRLGRP